MMTTHTLSVGAPNAVTYQMVLAAKKTGAGVRHKFSKIGPLFEDLYGRFMTFCGGTMESDAAAGLGSDFSNKKEQFLCLEFHGRRFGGTRLCPREEAEAGLLRCHNIYMGLQPIDLISLPGLFSERLKYLAMARRISCSQLARTAHVSHTVVGLWMRGKTLPDRDSHLALGNLEAKLGVPVGTLSGMPDLWHLKTMTFAEAERSTFRQSNYGKKCVENRTLLKAHPTYKTRSIAKLCWPIGFQKEFDAWARHEASRGLPWSNSVEKEKEYIVGSLLRLMIVDLGMQNEQISLLHLINSEIVDRIFDFEKKYCHHGRANTRICRYAAVLNSLLVESGYVQQLFFDRSRAGAEVREDTESHRKASWRLPTELGDKVQQRPSTWLTLFRGEKNKINNVLKRLKKEARSLDDEDKAGSAARISVIINFPNATEVIRYFLTKLAERCTGKNEYRLNSACRDYAMFFLALHANIGPSELVRIAYGPEEFYRLDNGDFRLRLSGPRVKYVDNIISVGTSLHGALSNYQKIRKYLPGGTVEHNSCQFFLPLACCRGRKILLMQDAITKRCVVLTKQILGDLAPAGLGLDALQKIMQKARLEVEVDGKASNIGAKMTSKQRHAVASSVIQLEINFN